MKGPSEAGIWLGLAISLAVSLHATPHTRLYAVETGLRLLLSIALDPVPSNAILRRAPRA